jgi:hypothetical protein
MGTAHRTHVSYIDRTRAYYAALGYPTPYQYARHDDVPFAPLRKPLAASRIALVTTAGPWHEDPSRRPRPFERRHVWAGSSAEPPQRLYTENLAWDKESTHTRDVQTFLPLGHLQSWADAGRIGGVGRRYYGVPTEYSQSRTSLEDAPAIAAMCREDEVDAVLLAAL